MKKFNLENIFQNSTIEYTHKILPSNLTKPINLKKIYQTFDQPSKKIT